MKFCSIASGSSGNCIYVGSENTHLLIDVGISKKKIEVGLEVIGVSPDKINGILVTHEHSDHIGGLGVISRGYQYPIYATEGSHKGIALSTKLGKMPEGLERIISIDEPFTIGDLTIEAFRISHDALEPSGFIISDGKKRMALATDLGKYDEYTIEKLSGLDGIFLEANHDIHMLEVGNYPYNLKKRVLGDQGHLSNELSGRLLCDILNSKLKYVVLGHISRENNYEMLAYETVKLEVLMNPTSFSWDDFELIIANRDGVKEIIEL